MKIPTLPDRFNTDNAPLHHIETKETKRKKTLQYGKQIDRLTFLFINHLCVYQGSFQMPMTEQFRDSININPVGKRQRSEGMPCPMERNGLIQSRSHCPSF